MPIMKGKRARKVSLLTGDRRTSFIIGSRYEPMRDSWQACIKTLPLSGERFDLNKPCIKPSPLSGVGLETFSLGSNVLRIAKMGTVAAGTEKGIKLRKTGAGIRKVIA